MTPRRFVRPDQISRRWNNYSKYVDNAKSLGKLLLLARRLCEAGCGFVTVTTNFVWDMHADQNNAGVEEGMEYMGLPLDHAALGIHRRLPVAGPIRQNPTCCHRRNGPHTESECQGRPGPLGRPGAASLVWRRAENGPGDWPIDARRRRAQSQPYTNENLVATVMHTLLDIGKVRLLAGLSQELQRVLTTPEPIRELF